MTPEQYERARGGVRMLSAGLRGVRHGFERAERGVQMIAEAEPRAVANAMDFARLLAPFMAKMDEVLANAEEALKHPPTTEGEAPDGR